MLTTVFLLQQNITYQNEWTDLEVLHGAMPLHTRWRPDHSGLSLELCAQ